MKQNKAFVAGLTGPAGCGKSYICKILKELTGALVLDTDTIARNQAAKGGISYNAIVREFGTGILLPNGELDRPALSAIVFNDAEKLKLLNSITHPNVISECKKLIRENRDKYSLIIVESAILVSSHCNEFCDEVWFVYSTKEERAERLKITRGYDDARIKSVMKSQNTVKYFRETSDETINNRKAADSAALEKSLKRLLDKKNISIVSCR